MKTICFVSMGELLVTKGGIHRVTYCLMNELKKRGYRCIYLFYRSYEKSVIYWK